MHERTDVHTIIAPFRRGSAMLGLFDTFPNSEVSDGLVVYIERGGRGPGGTPNPDRGGMTPTERHAPEERVREDDVVQVSAGGVVEDVLVDEEEQGHVDFFAGKQLLLLEAEAFDLSKIWGNLLKLP